MFFEVLMGGFLGWLAGHTEPEKHRIWREEIAPTIEVLQQINGWTMVFIGWNHKWAIMDSNGRIRHQGTQAYITKLWKDYGGQSPKTRTRRVLPKDVCPKCEFRYAWDGGQCGHCGHKGRAR